MLKTCHRIGISRSKERERETEKERFMILDKFEQERLPFGILTYIFFKDFSSFIK